MQDYKHKNSIATSSIASKNYVRSEVKIFDGFWKTVVLAALVAFLFGAVMYFVVNYYPVVYWSTSQDKCISVYTEDGMKPCSDIDLENDRYDIVRVK